MQGPVVNRQALGVNFSYLLLIPSMTSIYKNNIMPLIQFLGLGSAFLAFLFVVNNFIIFNYGSTGLLHTLNLSEFSGVEAPRGGFSNRAVALGFAQTAAIIAVISYSGYRAFGLRNLRKDALTLDWISAYIIRAAFWAVLIVGLTDAVLSFLRVEGFHNILFGEDVGAAIALPSARGLYVHVPLMFVSALIALRDKSVSLVWLALLVVVAEFLIVIARFIYGYEQTFMGDLVRFWYAALFLFASAYTLKEDGHVRVDVFYAGLQRKTKSTLNIIGIAFFGLPLCWLILARGMWGKSSLINSPMLNFETSMSGFGMYVKYLMAAFLIVFALSMIFQFTAYLLNSMADIEEKVSENVAKEDVET
jgi:TRAP-type mannitol/chloroaromatic compound transport system permease small subunit